MSHHEPRVEVLSRLPQLLALEEQLRSLFDLCPGAHLDNSFAWLVANAGVRRAGEQWRLFAAFDGDELVGWLFGYRTRSRKLRITVPTFVVGCEFVAEPLVKPGAGTAVLHALLETMLTDQAACKVIEFQYLRGAMFDAIAAYSRDTGRCEIAMAAGYGYLVNTDLDREAFLARLNGKSRREHARKLRRLSESYAVDYQFESTRDIAANLRCLDDFVALENSGWKGRDGTSIRARVGNEEYFRELVVRASEAGQIAWGKLQADGRPIAMDMYFLTHDTIWHPKTAYAEAFAQYSPGMQVMHSTLLRCCEDAALKRLNCISGPEWIEFWRPSRQDYRSLLLFGNTGTGRLLCMAYKLRYALQGMLTRSDPYARHKDKPYK